MRLKKKRISGLLLSAALPLNSFLTPPDGETTTGLGDFNLFAAYTFDISMPGEMFYGKEKRSNKMKPRQNTTAISAAVVGIVALLMAVSLPYQAFASGEVITGVATSAWDFTKGVGKTVGKSVGIGTTKGDLDQDVSLALDTLLSHSAAATKVSKTAKAVLVFPKILKAGFMIGGHHGEGALRMNGKTEGYYNTIAGSYGLQIGAQAFGYAMFFMDSEGLSYLLDNNAGWEVGVGPSVVFVDDGIATTMNNTTLTESVYVFTFNQKGLMAGLGIQGSKITRLTPLKDNKYLQ